MIMRPGVMRGIRAVCKQARAPLPGTVVIPLLTLAGGCGISTDAASDTEIERWFEEDGTISALSDYCDEDDGGITLPPGFCALLVDEGLEGVRHLEIAENGDIFIARRDMGDHRGGVTVLRDTTGDGRADVREEWGGRSGNDVLLHDGALYFAANDEILRYPIEANSMLPAGPPEAIVSALPDSMNHSRKSIAISGDHLYVAIGAPGNACMVESRTAGSPGIDPCPLLERRGGIWRFDLHRTGQRQDDGVRFSTGIRNMMALAAQPGADRLYGVIHGRDLLHALWPDQYTTQESAELPSEEFIKIVEGSDFGWPYCYHDPVTDRKVLAPEYGGDGTTVGRCADAEPPIIGFPAHWAPNDLAFYEGDHFPAHFRGGAFVAFHGSWNRAPEPEDGYRVAFIPFESGVPSTEWRVFADDFRRPGRLGGGQIYRPVGLAIGPDGSLYIADSSEGRIWRVVYSGSADPESS